ncbi:hypothetical protein T4D_8772, partial [Trichinella pseudospiralis]
LFEVPNASQYFWNGSKSETDDLVFGSTSGLLLKCGVAHCIYHVTNVHSLRVDDDEAGSINLKNTKRVPGILTLC